MLFKVGVSFEIILLAARIFLVRLGTNCSYFRLYQSSFVTVCRISLHFACEFLEIVITLQSLQLS